MSTDNININNINNIISEIIVFNTLYAGNLALIGLNSLININSNNSSSQINSQNPILIPGKDVSQILFNKNNEGDSVSSSESTNLFTNTENNSVLFKEETNFVSRKRCRERRPRKENQDNMRKKIKRGFLNHALLKKLNDKLRSIGSIKYFERFPQYFTSDVNQKRNKEILNMTLREIFEKKELYIHENEKGLSNYLHNLKVVQSEEIKENEEFKKIMKKKFQELYEEYINSDEFKIEEINRLKGKKLPDDYITRYIYLAKNLIEFFSQ